MIYFIILLVIGIIIGLILIYSRSEPIDFDLYSDINDINEEIDDIKMEISMLNDDLRELETLKEQINDKS